MSKLEISLGVKSRATGTLEGATVGFLAGALVGGIAGLARADSEASSDAIITTSRSSAENMVFGAVIFGLAGRVIGGVIGGLSAGERWEKVSNPFENFGIGVSPRAQSGISVTLSRRF